MHDSYTICYKSGTSSSTLSFAYALLWAPTGPKYGNGTHLCIISTAMRLW